MSVSDLSHQFSVTTETVRRDLSALEGMRLVRRVHGGAIAADAIIVPLVSPDAFLAHRSDLTGVAPSPYYSLDLRQVGLRA